MSCERKLFKIFLTILIASVILVGFYFKNDLLNYQQIQAWLDQAGIFAPVMFIVIYALATISFLPGLVLTITGGFLFGPIWGTLINMSGALLGSSIAFLVARFLAQSWVRSKTGKKLETIIQGVENEGYKFVAVLRLIPLIPYNLLNYALGLTKVSFAGYFIASAIFMLPACFAYTYLGSLGMEYLAGETKDLIGKIFIGIGLLVIIAIIPWILKKWRNINKTSL